MHKQAELVPQLLKQHAEGREWTVSMEQEFYVNNSGFLIRAEGHGPGSDGEQEWEEGTPADIRELGWTYVPATAAPLALLECFDPEAAKITKKYDGRETLILFGGLDGTVRYYGVGMTPKGREKEAAIGQVLASDAPGEPAPKAREIWDLLKDTWPMEPGTS
jgi:hypothetical protein